MPAVWPEDGAAHCRASWLSSLFFSIVHYRDVDMCSRYFGGFMRSRFLTFVFVIDLRGHLHRRPCMNICIWTHQRHRHILSGLLPPNSSLRRHSSWCGFFSSFPPMPTLFASRHRFRQLQRLHKKNNIGHVWTSWTADSRDYEKMGPKKKGDGDFRARVVYIHVQRQ
jgi:hypothetical protein